MVERGPILGVVLAGGLARRMGGGDKPMRNVAGRPILSHVLDRFAPQCDRVILNANGDPGRFASFDLPVVPDTVLEFPGPLAGILAALEWAAENRPDVALVASVAGDCPFLPRDLVERLTEMDAPIALAASGCRTHPIVGLWRVSLAPALRHALVVEDIRKVERFTGAHGAVAVEWPTDPVDPFFNANAPEDLAEAERLAPLAR